MPTSNSPAVDFVIPADRKNFKYAARYCDNQNRALVSILSENEQQEFSDFIENQTDEEGNVIEELLIGLRRHVNGSYVWTTSDIDGNDGGGGNEFRNWAYDQPNGPFIDENAVEHCGKKKIKHFFYLGFLFAAETKLFLFLKH